MNSGTKCRGTYTRSERDNKIVIDYILVNEAMCKHYDATEIGEDKLLYDLSDQVYNYVNILDKPRSSVCATRISLGLMINAGTLLASRRKLIFDGP